MNGKISLDLINKFDTLEGDNLLLFKNQVCETVLKYGGIKLNPNVIKVNIPEKYDQIILVADIDCNITHCIRYDETGDVEFICEMQTKSKQEIKTIVRDAKRCMYLPINNDLELSRLIDTEIPNYTLIKPSDIIDPDFYPDARTVIDLLVGYLANGNEYILVANRGKYSENTFWKVKNGILELIWIGFDGHPHELGYKYTEDGLCVCLDYGSLYSWSECKVLYENPGFNGYKFVDSEILCSKSGWRVISNVQDG